MRDEIIVGSIPLLPPGRRRAVKGQRLGTSTR